MLHKDEVKSLKDRIFHVRVVHTSTDDHRDSYNGGQLEAYIGIEFLDGPLQNEYVDAETEITD